MSKKLLESEFLSVDLRSILNNQIDTSSDKSANNSKAPQSSEELPGAGEWQKWEKLLNTRLNNNKSLSNEAKYTDYEIEEKFFKEFFTVNWGETLGKKLALIGENLRKALKILKFDPNKNPILGFIVQDYVKEKLIAPGLLNISTFKAIYNAVAKKLVADSEFIREARKDEFNIIYCQDLYKKPVSEIEKYLNLQSKILKIGSTYDTALQTKNKKVFLHIDAISAPDYNKRALEINKEETKAADSVFNAELNSLELAEIINGKKETPTTTLDNDGQNKVLRQLNTPAKIFAALMSLSLSTNNTEASKVLSNALFSRINVQQLAEATAWLAKNNVIAKGQLQDSDAKALVTKIVAKLATMQK